MCSMDKRDNVITISYVIRYIKGYMAPYRDTNGLKWCTKYVTVEYQHRIKYGLKRIYTR